MGPRAGLEGSRKFRLLRVLRESTSKVLETFDN